MALGPGLAARLLNIPIITHDSDALPGLTNRIIGRKAVARAIGIPSEDQNYTFTGVPISSEFKPASTKEREEIKKKLGIKGPFLLVTGGGQGPGRSMR